MAEGAWVPAYDTLWSSRKTRRLARDVRSFMGAIDTADVAGAKFLRLMSWMRENVPSGDLGSIDRATIALAIGLARPTDKHDVQVARGEAFYRSLVGAEFISDDARGHVRGWEEGPGKLVARREEDRLRKEHQRSGHGRTMGGRGSDEGRTMGGGRYLEGSSHTQFHTGCPTCRRAADQNSPVSAPTRPASAGRPQDSTTVSSGRPQDVRRRGEERRGEKQEESPQPPPAAPDGDARARAELLIASADEPLQTALATLLDDGRLTSTAVVTFFAGTRLEQPGGNGSWTLWVPNEFVRDWVRQRYVGSLREALQAGMVVCDRIDVALIGGPREPDVVEPEA